MEGLKLPGLEGKTALVTGANQGIGWGIATLLAGQGVRVAVNHPTMATRPEQLTELGAGAIAVQADVSSAEERRTLFAEVLGAFEGKLDILVNNAGIFPRADVMDLDEATWDDVLGTNLKATFFCTQAAARAMIPRRSGRIVSITSGAALSSQPNSTHYSASKAGIVAVTKGFARALAPHGIGVNAVAPGITDTAQPRFGMTEEEIAASGRATPWGRIGQPEDIARAVLYFASDLSEYVTGQTLFVNGGSQMVP